MHWRLAPDERWMSLESLTSSAILMGLKTDTGGVPPLLSSRGLLFAGENSFSMAELALSVCRRMLCIHASSLQATERQTITRANMDEVVKSGTGKSFSTKINCLFHKVLRYFPKTHSLN